jgi:hypothetical protein
MQDNRDNRSVADMVNEVLSRQAVARADQTGELFEDALDAVLETEAGRQLRKLRDGPRRHERADEWQANVAKERTEERTAALGGPLPGEALDSPTDG